MSPIRLRLRELREARGWTQAELASRAGVARATVNRLEQRPPRLLDLVTMERLARALGVDPAVLLVTERRAPTRRRPE